VAKTYDVTLSIRVTETDKAEAIVEENNIFPKITFAKMANVSDAFYELVTKLKK